MKLGNGSQATAAGGRRPAALGSPLLFMDPIGHLLSSHDDAICSRMARCGHVVMLATSEEKRSSRPSPNYARETLFCHAVGQGSRARKAYHYLLAHARIRQRVRTMHARAAVLYYALQPQLDARLLRRLRRTGIPSILCVHDVLPLHWQKDRLFAYRTLYRSATKCLVFSRYAQEQLAQLMDWPRASIAVAPLGMEPTPPLPPGRRPEAKSSLGIPLDEETILCFGQIKQNKDLETLIAAFQEVAASRPATRLRVVGRPWHLSLAPYRQQCRRMGLEERVRFHDRWISKERVDTWFDAADVVALSYTNLFQSDVLLKACSRQRPVVATRVGNMAEHLKHGHNAWLVAPKRPASMAQALLYVLSDPAAAALRARRARTDLAKLCDWDHFSFTLTELVNDICSRAIPLSGQVLAARSAERDA